MRPTTATHDNVFDFQALLHPGTVFEHPKDVVSHPDLTLAEKRAILASWASDASAIASCQRAPEGLKAPISIDAILEALCELDGGPRNPPGGTPKRRFSTARALAACGGMHGRYPVTSSRDHPSGASLGEPAAPEREGLERREGQFGSVTPCAVLRTARHPCHRRTFSPGYGCA